MDTTTEKNHNAAAQSSANPYKDLLQHPSKITAHDVLRLRREVFQDGIMVQSEAESVFALNDSVENRCPEWNEFFAEAMTVYVVEQAEPRGYVSNHNAQWLVDRISHDGVVDSATELELLVRVLAKANQCPEALGAFALAQIAYAVIEGDGPLARGLKLTKGVIGQPEVELLRTVLYAVGGANGMSISKQEAEILFDLNDRTDSTRNHASWRDLFVRATANYLMAVSSSHAPSRAAALAREEWLEETDEDSIGLVGDVFASLGKVFSETFFDDVFTSSHVQMERSWKSRNDANATAARHAEQVDTSEANWLISRIHKDGNMNANEQALLAFVQRESHSVDPRILQLLKGAA